MTEVDLSRLPVNGGFFILSGKKSGPFVWPARCDGPLEFMGTYRNSGAPIRDALISMIESAQHRVFIASFMLGDEAVIQALLRAAERLRGGVYVITALDEKSLRRGMRELEGNDGESPEERKKNFKRLTTGGIYVRGHAECHAKLAVVDSSVALLGSANFVTNGFTWTGEANIRVTDREIVLNVARLFADLWYRGCGWEIPPGETYSVAERQPSQSPAPVPVEITGGQGVVWTNGDESHGLLAAIHNVIDGSRSELLLASYSIVGMRENPGLLIDSVRRARTRGVRVKLLIRQRNAYPEQMADVVALADMGVEVYGDTRNHAKVAIADGKDAVVFSANFDAKHGLTSGVEAGIRLNDHRTIGHLCAYLAHAMTEADTSFALHPTHGDIDGRLAARWCKPWPHKGPVRFAGGAAHCRRLFDSLRVGPVLFEQAKSGLCRLYAGDVAADLAILDSGTGTAVLQNLDNAKDSSSERLKTWLSSVREEKMDGPVRGFCSARVCLATTPLA